MPNPTTTLVRLRKRDLLALVTAMLVSSPANANFVRESPFAGWQRCIESAKRLVAAVETSIEDDETA